MTTETDQEIVIAEAAVEAAPLTTTEQQDLARCEAIIQRGLDTFVEVGEALAEIRNQRLYRQEHPNFEEYLRTRWPQVGGRRQADRLIVASEVAADLRPIGLSVANEAQARELAPLAPDERRAAMQQAVVAAPGGTPTAKQIQQAAAAVRPPPGHPKAPAAAPPLAPASATMPPALAIPAKTPAAAPATLPPALSIPAETPAPAAQASPASSALPPALPIFTSATDAAAALEAQAWKRKLLVAKRALLVEALAVIEVDLERSTTPTTPTITISQDRVVEAARQFAHGQVLSSAATMLAFAAVVEEAPQPAAESYPSTLLGIVEGLIAGVEERLRSGDLNDEELADLRAAGRDLDDLVASLDDATYEALAARISAAERTLRERQEVSA